MLRFSTTARWICGGVAVAALAASCLDTLGAKRYSEPLAAERAAARRDGVPVFVPDLAKPLPSADQNAAVIYESLPAYNYEDAKSKAEDDLYSRLTKSPTTLSVADWQAVQKTVADNAPRLRAIHEAVNRPDCVFHHDYQTAHPEDMLLSELSRMRSGARQLSMESLLMAHEGNGVAAVANARLGFRLADHANSDPLLIGYLVAVAVDKITLNTMQKILLLAPNSSATADAVLASVKEVRLRSLKPALGSESAFDQTICETVRKEGVTGLQKVMAASAGEAPPAPLPMALTVAVALRRPVWNRIIDKNALQMLRINRAMIAVCDKPYREGQPAASRILTDVESSHDPESLLTSILMPTETKLLHNRAVTANKISVTQAAATVMAYRAAHGGALPAHLADALTPSPTSAFDGSPLAYHIAGNGFTIEALDPADPHNKSSMVTFTLPATQ